MNNAALADALAGATVEQLRADAFMALQLADFDESCGALAVAATSRRLAALALAIAHAANTSDARIEQAGRADYLILDIPLPETHMMGYGACEVLPALAALLRGAP